MDANAVESRLGRCDRCEKKISSLSVENFIESITFSIPAQKMFRVYLNARDALSIEKKNYVSFGTTVVNIIESITFSISARKMFRVCLNAILKKKLSSAVKFRSIEKKNHVRRSNFG